MLPNTGRWPACIESVFYWICGSRIFSLETLLLLQREREASISSICTVQAEHAGQDSKFCVGYTSACVTGSADIMVSRYVAPFHTSVISCCSTA